MCFHSQSYFFKERQYNRFKVFLRAGGKGKTPYIEHYMIFCYSATKEWFSLRISHKKSSSNCNIYLQEHTQNQKLHLQRPGQVFALWGGLGNSRATLQLDQFPMTMYYCSTAVGIASCHVINFSKKIVPLKVMFGFKKENFPRNFIYKSKKLIISCKPSVTCSRKVSESPRIYC